MNLYYTIPLGMSIIFFKFVTIQNIGIVLNGRK